MARDELTKLRLDKWLWAARFFKTRTLAKTAIENGKVEVDGQRPKPSRDISVGAILAIKQGWDKKTVEVLALSDQRRSAPEAAQLYQETQESLREREIATAQRKASNATQPQTEGRPSKKQRRLIHRFRELDTW